MTHDYHCEQMDGSPCQSKNCAACSGSMAIAFGTHYHDLLTGAEFRHDSGVSCIPGQATPSGGLFISDVVRVCDAHDVDIDYGSDQDTYYERWTPAQAKARLKAGWGAIFLGYYSEIPAPERAPGSTFQNEHSAWGHDFLTHLPAHGTAKPTETICWHDPLRTGPIRLSWKTLLKYWQKAGSAIRGFAGFVRGTPIAPDTGQPPVAYGADVGPDIRSLDPPGRSAQEWIKRTGVGPEHWKPPMNLGDFAAAMDRVGIDYGTVPNRADVINLSEWRKP